MLSLIYVLIDVGWSLWIIMVICIFVVLKINGRVI